MDSVAIEMLRQVRDELAALRRETADMGIDLADRLDRIERGHTAPAAAEGADLLSAIATGFGEREFLAVELMAWCSKCVDQAQRDAYRALQTLCKDDNPTSAQAGMALRALAGAPGPLLLERRGEKRGSALWAVGVVPQSRTSACQDGHSITE